MNNQMKPWENKETMQGEIIEAVQAAMLDEDIEECLDFSYEGFQVVRREFFAHIFDIFNVKLVFAFSTYKNRIHIIILPRLLFF